MSYPLFYRLAFLFFHRLISTLGHCPNLISLHRLISPSHTVTSAPSCTVRSRLPALPLLHLPSSSDLAFSNYHICIFFHCLVSRSDDTNLYFLTPSNCIPFRRLISPPDITFSPNTSLLSYNFYFYLLSPSDFTVRSRFLTTSTSIFFHRPISPSDLAFFHRRIDTFSYRPFSQCLVANFTRQHCRS